MNTPAATGLSTNRPAAPAGSLALAAAVAATAASAGPDAALIDLGRRWLDVQADWMRLEEARALSLPQGHDDDGEVIGAREDATVDAIVTSPATTLAGLAVKVRVMAREASELEGFDGFSVIAWAEEQVRTRVWLNRIMGSIVLDLLRPAGEAGL